MSINCVLYNGYNKIKEFRMAKFIPYIRTPKPFDIVLSNQFLEDDSKITRLEYLEYVFSGIALDGRYVYQLREK